MKNIIKDFLTGYVIGYVVQSAIQGLQNREPVYKQQVLQPDIYVESRIVMPEDDD